MKFPSNNCTKLTTEYINESRIDKQRICQRLIHGLEIQLWKRKEIAFIILVLSGNELRASTNNAEYN